MAFQNNHKQVDINWWVLIRGFQKNQDINWWGINWRNNGKILIQLRGGEN